MKKVKQPIKRSCHLMVNKSFNFNYLRKKKSDKDVEYGHGPFEYN